jgi:hypothetical protein
LIEQSFEFSAIASRKVSREIIIHLLVIINIIHPLGHSEVGFLFLEIIGIEGVDITLIILLIVQHIHAIVVFIGYVIVSDDEVYVACCLF